MVGDGWVSTYSTEANPITQENSHGDKASEPEQHGQSFECDDSPFWSGGLGHVGEFEGHDDEDCESEDGP